MRQEEGKNLILAAVLSMVVVLGWYLLFPPAPPEMDTPTEQQVEAQATGIPAPAGDAVAPGEVAGTPAAPGAAAPGTPVSREAALAEGTRIPISTPSLTGSIRLEGARIDDLHLRDYRVSVDPRSETVVLLNPAGGPDAYFSDFGWVPVEGSNPGPLPDESTEWTVESGEQLTPDSPVTLAWDNGEGLIFRREIALDDEYMFTIRQSVENQTEAPLSLAPYGRITRMGGEASTALWILHEGGIAFTDNKLVEISYSDLEDLPSSPGQTGGLETFQIAENGWLGFTDKYWMTTM